MQTVIEILIDLSTSMKEKLSLIQNTLTNDIIPALDYSAKIGVKTFTATANKTPIIKTILPLSITNKEQIIFALNSLPIPDGNTPIAEAIKNSVTSLKEYMAYDKKIILITDGEENCDGNYSEEVKKAQADGINCQIHIIGIGLTESASNQAKSITTSSNGSFSSIPYSSGMAYNQAAIKQNLSNFHSAVRPTYTRPIGPQNSITPIAIEQPLTQPKQAVQNDTENDVNVAEVNILAATEQSLTQPKQAVQNDTEDDVDVAEVNIPKASMNFTDEGMKFLISEIQSIKEQISELKKEKKEEIPENREDSTLLEKIRITSEEYLYDLLKKKYGSRVKWLNENGESYSDHDFEILDLDGSIEYYIECKGTTKNKPTFYITKDEWRLFLNHTKNYQLYFIKYSLSNPIPIFIDNLLDWLLKGKIVPYLKVKESIDENRVFLTVTGD